MAQLQRHLHRAGQGKRYQGQEPVTPVYNWFTEDFETKDLNRAKVLRRELG